jgi:hypothetical protein
MTLAKGMLRLHVTDERASLVNGKYDVNSTKYTFFHTSVSDATADAIRRNNPDSRDQPRKSDIISTSLAASTALSKRSYLYWSVPDRSVSFPLILNTVNSMFSIENIGRPS